MISALLIITGYLVGGLPSGVWLARLGGVDVQRSGSGNIGATNVARTAGWRLGLLTLISDAAKGIAPVALAQWLDVGPPTQAAVGLAVVCGHIFSPLLRFRGGKGVATAAGVFLVLAPAVLAIALLVFAGTAVATRYVSLASILAAATLPFAALLLGCAAPITVVAVVVAILITGRHHENIRRLMSGQEPRFRASK